MWSIKLLWSPSKRSRAAGDHFCAFGPHTTVFCAFWAHTTAVPILPPPAVTGYYWPPGHETFTFRPFTEETHRTQCESATFRLSLFTTFFTTHHSIFKTVSLCRTGDVAVRADLGAGSPWTDFVRHHVVVGVQRKHALVPTWPSNCSSR